MPITRHSRSELDLAKIDWTKADSTTEEQIAHQAGEDSDTAPIFTPEEILAASRRVSPEEIEDVRRLRERLGLSQAAFAARYGFSVAAIRQYETHRRRPTGPIRTLLRVIASEPDAVTRALAQSRPLSPPLSSEEGRSWLEDSRGSFDETVRDPWK